MAARKFGADHIRLTFGGKWVTVERVTAACFALIPPEEALRVRRRQNEGRRKAAADTNQKAETHDEKVRVGAKMIVGRTLVGMYHADTAERRKTDGRTEYRPRPPGPRKKPVRE